MEKIIEYKKAMIVNLANNHVLIMPYKGNMTENKKNKCASALIQFLDDKDIEYPKQGNLHALALVHLKYHSICVVDLKVKNYKFTHKDGSTFDYVDYSHTNGSSIANFPENIKIQEIN